MKQLRIIIVGVLALVLTASVAFAQTSPLTIAKGGTNAQTAAAARTNLGLAIGSATQAWDADLDCFAALAGTGILRRTGAGTCSNGTVVSVAEGGTGVTALGTGVVTALGVNVGSAGAFVTFNGAMGTPSSGTATNLTGLPVATGVSGLGTGIATALAVNTGSAGAPVLFNGALGTPSSGTLTSATGLPVSTGISGLASGIASWLATSSSANLATALTDETGTGAAVFANSPTLVTPALGTPSSGIATNLTGLPIATGVSGLGTGIATALAVNTGSAGAPVLFNGALGTPSSGTLTNATDLPIDTGVSGLASGIASWLATSSSANLATALTDETGSGAAVFGTAPTISAPVITGAADAQGTLKLSSFVTSTQLAADANNYTATDGSDTCSTKGTLRISTDASRSVTGLSCGQAEGDVRIIYNVGSFDVVLTNEDSGSTAGNRFLIGGDMTLLTNYSVTVKYDGVSERWRAITTPGAGGGGGGVTSVTIAGSGGVTATGTCTVTTSGTCTVTGYVAPPQGRLTLQSATPVMTTTQSAKTTIYYSAYAGNQIPIYDGTSMVPTVITGGEISADTTDTTKSPAAIGASKINDWFVWKDGSTVTLSHGPDWTSDTVRSAGTALTMVNGIWVNAVAITNACAIERCTYVGTTRSNSSSQLDWIYGAVSTGGTRSWFGVWNAYNHVEVVAFSGDDTNSWTYATATWRTANAGSVAHLFVRGLDEDGVHAVYDALMTVSATNAYVAVGLDSTTAKAGTAAISNNASTTMISPKYSGLPGIGFHGVYAIEYSSGATSTFYGDVGTPLLVQTGLHFRMHM